MMMAREVKAAPIRAASNGILFFESVADTNLYKNKNKTVIIKIGVREIKPFTRMA